MKGFILAAGLGTRLRPFTLQNPKALVPVGGVPMLERVILRMKDEGITKIIINIHHFGEKIIEFLKLNNNFGIDILISDERDLLRDTGGAILHAGTLLSEDEEPVLIHNVDILSDAPLRSIGKEFTESNADAALIVSSRNSSRQLIFTDSFRLCVWHNSKEGIYKPADMTRDLVERANLQERAFSGIHIIRPKSILAEMERQGRGEVFSIIDFYLAACDKLKIIGTDCINLSLIDIGKPDTLSQACRLFE